MSVKFFISIFLLLLISLFLLTCEEKETPTNQIPTASVYGYVSINIGESVVLIENAIVSINDISDTTDSNGYYRLDNVLFGEQTITCIHNEYGAFSTTIEILDYNFIYDIKYPVWNLISGIVFHEYDGRISGAIVTLDNRVDTTDNDGAFVFYNINPGTYTIVCSHPDYDLFSSEVTILDLPQTNIGIELAKTKFAVIGQVVHYIDGNIEGAEVIIGDNIDTTDINGRYRFALIDKGSHTIECSHPEYLSYIGTIEIIDDSLIYNIEMLYVLDYPIDTLWIEEDAYIHYSSVNTSNNNNTNYGSESRLHLGYLHWSETIYDSTGGWWTIYHHAASRFLVKIPDINTIQVDSVIMRIIPVWVQYSPFGTCCLVLNYITEDWSENLLTWVNQPSVFSETVIVPIPHPDDTSSWYINITDYFNQNESFYGIQCSYQYEFDHIHECSYYFSSSETATEVNRPHVIIYYSQ